MTKPDESTANELPAAPPPAEAGGEDVTALPRKVDFAVLAQGGKEVLIQHGSEIYRLRLTRNGRLILNK